MPDTPQFLSERLQSEGEKTLAFFNELSPDQWEQTIYTDGTAWAVRQVLAHFVSAETSFGALIDNILAGGSGAPDDFDIDAFNQRAVAALSEVSFPELLTRYEALRRKTAQKVSRMTQDDLDRQGRHPFLGVVPLGGIIKMLYRHNQIHIRDVRRALSS